METAGTLQSVEISHFLLKSGSSHTFQKTTFDNPTDNLQLPV